MTDKTVFVLLSGDGSDGDEQTIVSIHSTKELAELWQDRYAEAEKSIYGAKRYTEIEEWIVDQWEK